MRHKNEKPKGEEFTAEDAEDAEKTNEAAARARNKPKSANPFEAIVTPVALLRGSGRMGYDGDGYRLLELKIELGF